MANKLLLIGIDEYISHPHLNCCVKDVIDFKEILLEKYDFEDNNVYQILDNDATNVNIQEAFKYHIQNVDKNDNLIVFYSGHGSYDVTADKGYWIPVDGSKDYTTWLPNEVVIQYLTKINAKHIFLISDSCFSGALLTTSGSKSTADYINLSSRWALTSSFYESYDSNRGENTLFGETILEFLKSSDKDFRVGELIEYVKKNFEVNIRQSPQGYPMAMSAHRGGEFIFKVRQDGDNRKFKGYSDFRKILQLYKRNAEFKQIEIFEDKASRVGYQLFMENDVVIKKVTYYLYLNEGIVQNRTLQRLKEIYKEIFRERNLIIFLTKERKQVNPDARKNNIHQKFKPLSTFYIDDFIREQCTPKISTDSANYLNISNFILPSYQVETPHENIKQYIHDWIHKEDEPILVIVGAGGIGKTTFAQFIADQISKISVDCSILFIDSVQVKDGLLKRKKFYSEINLYNFYEALHEIANLYHEKLNEDLFRINLDAGNILIIIDGLDEVISKIPNFNVQAFLKSIYDNTRGIGGGKVIITCRTYFWEGAQATESKFIKMELLPFSVNQAISFFEKSFDSDEIKIKKALKIAEGFQYPAIDRENNFHPYVLDVIRSIIMSDQEALYSDFSTLDSTELNEQIKNDYIVFRICDRERKRIGQVSVGDQLKFFVHLAVKKRGVINIENFGEELSSAIGTHIDNTTVEAFKAHPFIFQFDRTSRFKYDFLTDYFRGIFLTEYFNYNSNIESPDDTFITLSAETCWSGSPMIADIVQRTKQWDIDDILFVSDIIDQLNLIEDIDPILKRKALASIFNVCLSMNIKVKGIGIEENTNLLKALFGKGNTLSNVSILNLNFSEKIKFDFSNLNIINAYIDNFTQFWECRFENTNFIQCHLLNLGSRRRSVNISQSNFRECVYDETLTDALARNKENELDRRAKSKQFLDSFFHLFLSNGRLERQSERDVIKVRYSGINKHAFVDTPLSQQH